MRKTSFWNHRFTRSRVRSEKVQLPEMLFGYILGPMGATVSSSIFTSILQSYFTDVLRLDLQFLTRLQLVSTVLIVIANLVVGQLIEQTRAMAGKARPWLLLSAFTLSSACVLMFIVPFRGTARMVWIAIAYNLYYAFASPIYSTASTIMISVSTRDSHQRGMLASINSMMGLGVMGAALATLTARIVSALVMVVLLSRKDNPLCIATPGCMKPQRDVIGKILKIGIPSGVENGMFQIGKLLVSSLTATFGTAAIAANAVANSVAGFANIPGIAIGLAIVTVIGRCIGAGEKEQARYYSKRLLGLAYAGMVLADLALFVLVKPIIACFALSAEAARIATQLLVSFAVCAALIWPLSFTLPNVLRAAGDAKYTMEVSVFSMWVFRVASSYFFAGTMGLGVLGVWIGMYVDWAFRTLLFVIRYRRGRWLEKRVV